MNVVLVALQENILDETFAELQAQFKTRKFIKVGVNLGTPGYLDKIDEATKAVGVQLVFNNAGFMLTGFFDKQCVQSHNIYRTFYRTLPTTDMSLYISISPSIARPLAKLMVNHECNATSAMQITHLFVTRMLSRNLRGCVVFTSSAAACQPTPFSALYGATKAYISSFAANIAVELRSREIDVCAVHHSLRCKQLLRPSP